jgi:hypothetical protein
MNELVAKFQSLEELSSWLEGLGARMCALLIGPSASQARWAERLDETASNLRQK